MARFGGLIILLLAYTDLSRAQANNGFRNGLSSPNHRKDARYGRPVLAMANSPRCMFNGKPVEDGRTVSSPEPCLNCTCSKGILLCYLRTCTTVIPTPGCQVIRKPGKCCPQLECKSSSTVNDYRIERTSESSYKYRLRQDEGNFFGLIGMDPRTEKTSTIKTTRKPAPSQWSNHDSTQYAWNSDSTSDNEFRPPLAQEQDYVEDEFSQDKNNSAGYCFSKGYKYTEGMAMLSPTKCEYCYCIRGQQMCVRPKCHLNVDGCVARYQSGYTCCPSHYQCEIAADSSHSSNDDGSYTLDSIKGSSSALSKVTSCNVEGYDFDVGVAVPSNGHCQTCYCTQVGVVCRRLECSPSVPGCTPVIPEGHCCPTEYRCDHRNVNNTQIPISHSTDNYDVTVLSPSGTDSTSSQPSEIDHSELVTHNFEQKTSTYSDEINTATEADIEKQKITVELSDDSNLESISVIPEENIAVLVLTTENEDQERAEPTASSQNTEETDSYEDMSTRSTTALLSSAKNKNKTIPPKSSGTKIKNKDTVSTYFTSQNTKPTTSGTTNNEQITDRVDYGDEEKDTYAYDYVELYEDVTPNVQETFAPFADYSEIPYGERLTTTTKGIDSTTTAHSRLKTKKKTQTFPSQHPTTQTLKTSTTKQGIINDGITETELFANPDYTSTFTGTETDRYTSFNPTKYTIFSTVSDRTRKPPAAEFTMPSFKTKQKVTQIYRPYRPDSAGIRKDDVAPTTHFRDETSRYITSSGTIKYETDPYDATTIKKDYPIYVDETNTQTFKPYSQTTQPSSKATIYQKQKLQSSTQAISGYKTKKPLPQDITDLLWSITQLYNTQTSDSSTETWLPTTKTVTHMEKVSGNTGLSQGTLPPIALAAPKLIVEESTVDTSIGSQETDTTQIPTTQAKENLPSPSFNFQSPEIIFSNHGPSFNRRKTPNTELPVVINNHKKTSTRFRPPVRPRPPSTPSAPQTTFVEISNHRPTNSFRRPPGKFPPYPSYGFRHEPDSRRKPSPRDPHHKFHRLAPESYPELSEDYEDYYYESEQNGEPTTKVFSNIQDIKSTSIDNFQIHHSGNDDTTKSEIYTNSYNFVNNMTDSTPETFETLSEISSVSNTYQEKTTTEVSIENLNSVKAENSDDVIGRSSEVKYALKADASEETVTPHITTTKIPTTFQASTTNSVSVYTTGKQTESNGFSEEESLSRTEYENKNVVSKFAENRFTNFDGIPTHFEETNKRTGSPDTESSRPTAPTRPTSPPLPIKSVHSEEDSQEISDVCFVDGRYYTSGEIIVKSNPCEMCRCFYGHPLCQVQQCPSPPDPSCMLEYLPGYCCPRVTCGIKSDSEEIPRGMDVPEPTSQEIQTPIITMDNQWKPLPHGPIVRPSDKVHKIEQPTSENEKIEENSNNQDFSSEKNEESVKLPEDNTVVKAAESNSAPVSSEEQTHVELTTTSSAIITTIISDAATASPSPILATTEDSGTTSAPTTTTTMTTNKSLEPIFNHTASEKENISKNKSGIHDNSSGVRKILDEVVTLPPSKVALSPSGDANISTVLPIIPTVQSTTGSTISPDDELETMPNIVLGDLPAELGGNLKVSGCNVYGKYYKINDKVTVLSKKCSDCICSADGIACNATC
ncbi:mucin-5AC-like isoform X2 [Stegodyphus dumicola]|uniref:mucin-5AC-like isoform X2 n=1 Tax=Stegodyphus dumicola TaxID=202533 RepID=UPI0015B01E5B|nr:mucin-5AC-like isoform X2 [Stegodyphus dumicola]